MKHNNHQQSSIELAVWNKRIVSSLSRICESRHGVITIGWSFRAPPLLHVSLSLYRSIAVSMIYDSIASYVVDVHVVFSCYGLVNAGHACGLNKRMRMWRKKSKWKYLLAWYSTYSMFEIRVEWIYFRFGFSKKVLNKAISQLLFLYFFEFPFILSSILPGRYFWGTREVVGAENSLGQRSDWKLSTAKRII